MTVYLGIRIPAPATLAKYGLSLKDWRELVKAQGGRCGGCGRTPPSGRLNIDHEHIRGWKRLRPDDRKRYVRGLVDFQCNAHWLSRGATPEVLRGCADYLERYRVRFEGLH